MAMGKCRPRQEELFALNSNPPKTLGHPFYLALNRDLRHVSTTMA